MAAWCPSLGAQGYSFLFVCFRGSQSRGPVRATAAAYTTGTATLYLSHVCYLHHSSWQHHVLNPLSEARDWTHVFMDASQARYCWATMGTLSFFFFFTFWLADPSLHIKCGLWPSEKAMWWGSRTRWHQVRLTWSRCIRLAWSPCVRLTWFPCVRLAWFPCLLCLTGLPPWTRYWLFVSIKLWSNSSNYGTVLGKCL